MKTRISVIALALIFSGLLQSCHSGKSEIKTTRSVDTIPVKVVAVKKEKNEYSINASGQFTTNDETLLSFKTGGIISSLKVKEGDFIKKGQLLAMLNLTEIEAQVSQAKFAMEKSERDYQRISHLYRDSVATLEQLQNAKTGLDVAAQQYASANFNLSHSQIRALGDGYVLKKLANEGQYVSAGTPVMETNGAGKKDWILKVGLSDRQWSNVKIGDLAILETDAYPGKQMHGIVVRKSEAADASSGAFVIEIKVTDQKSLPLAAGLFGKAQITTSQTQELWSIPYEALLDGNGNSGFVFVTNDNKTVQKLGVEISSIDKDKVYISKGLENVSKLIVAGNPYLKENSIITIIQ